MHYSAVLRYKENRYRKSFPSQAFIACAGLRQFGFCCVHRQLALHLASNCGECVQRFQASTCVTFYIYGKQIAESTEYFYKIQ